MFDSESYIMGYTSGKTAGKSDVVIESGFTCTDDGNGNITITEVTNNG